MATSADFNLAIDKTSDERPLIPVSDALALVQAIDQPYGALLLLATTCGLRLGELLGLTRADLDFRTPANSPESI